MITSTSGPRRRWRPPSIRAAGTAFAVLAGSLLLPVTQSVAHESAYDVLVFSETAGFRHDSIDEGIAAIKKLGRENGFSVDATEDSAQFTDENLAMTLVTLI